MPWSNQSGGGGNNGPWGPRPGGPGQQPDLEEILRKSQDRLRQAMPGGRMGGPLAALIGVILASVIGFFLFTVRVNPDELGIVLRFGEYVRQLPPGLNFRLPYPIEEVALPKVTRVNRIEVGMREPAQPGRGMVPINVPEESLMLTGDENIVDIDFVVFWQISDAPDYLFNIQNPEGTVKDVAESAMREIVGQSDIEPILTAARAETESKGQQLIQRILDGYGAGILIVQVQLQKVDPPEQVIDDFRDVQAARADEERFQNQAQAYANKVVPEARGEAERILQSAQGYRDRVIAEAKGEADRFEKVLQEYEKAPEVTRKRIFIETMQEVFSNTDKIIIDEKSGGIVPYLPLSELQKRTPSAPSASSSETQNGGQQ